MSKVSQIKALAFQVAPGFVQKRILEYLENKKMAYWQECFNTKVSRSEIDDLFSQMDLNSDVMIHSSLPDLGQIKLRDVTANLSEHVLERGNTVLCPALPVKGSSLDYLKSIKEFDVRTAPNAMGAISCFYGRQKESRRSLSPTHSVVAHGERAFYYVEGHHLSRTPFSERSPYFKLIQNKGKILMLGASLKNLTFVHVVDDMIGESALPVRVYDPRIFEVKVIDEFGIETNGFFQAHSRKNSRMRDTVEIMKKVRDLDSTRVFRVGCGEVLLLDAKDVCLCLLSNLKNGISSVGHIRVTHECLRQADDWIKRIEQI